MVLSSLKAVGLADLLDMVLVAVLIYAVLVWFKRAKAAFVAKGMLVLTAVYLFSWSTGMVMTTGIFHGFFAIFLVTLVVIFQEELRSVFERIAIWSLSVSDAPSASDQQTEMLVRALEDMARDRTGALVVLRGRDPLERHLEGGWALAGTLSEAILKSIFDFHSIGHDGAVVVEGGKIAKFGCRLPLAKEVGRTARLGTRHMAALGLADLTDALCIVVSEERGTLSIAQDGKIETMRGTNQLQRRIGQFLRDKNPRTEKDPFQVFLQRNSREKAIAISAALVLWILFVLGAKDWRQDYEVEVAVRNIPAGMNVVRVRPENVQVVFAGQMRDFYLVDRRKLAVRLDLAQAQRGLNYVRLSEADVSRPSRFKLLEIDPTLVEVELMRKKDSPQLSKWQ